MLFVLLNDNDKLMTPDYLAIATILTLSKLLLIRYIHVMVINDTISRTVTII